ncbi:MAG: 2OG-Fe(II) oxygenase [Lysobacterales bacterium]
MEVSILADKIVVAENVFEPREYDMVSKEIASLRQFIEPTYHGSDVILYRTVLDQLYGDRKRSFALQILPEKLYSRSILDQTDTLHDLSYTLVNKQHKFTTALTEMRSDTDYRTHTDTGSGVGWTQIFMSWIWYHNPQPEKFTDGDLIVEDLGLTIEPKDNRLVLLPAYLNHRITPAIYAADSGDYYRTTLNGFFTIG